MAAVRMWRRPTRAVSDFITGNGNSFRRLRSVQRCAQHHYSVQTKELAEEAQYPPVKPRYPPGRWGSMKEQLAWEMYEESEAVEAVSDRKERLEKLAGVESRTLWDLAPLNSQPGSLPFKQYITKTHIIEGLPEKFSGPLDISNFERIKAQVINAILQEQYLVKSKVYKEAENTSTKKNSDGHDLMRSVLATILPYAIMERPHIQNIQFDENVRLESFIRRQGFEESKMRRPKPKNWLYFQMKCTASFQIRTESPIVPFVPLNDPICSGDYPQEVYEPVTMGFRRYRERPISVSGHWLGDPCEWSVLNIHEMAPSYDWFTQEHGEALTHKELVPYGLVTSFTSAVAQAHNQGFNTFQELAYPIVAQTVVTNGMFFQFFCYQLNTVHLWKPDDANPLRNLLWVSPLLKLYEGLEESKVHGFNDTILSCLLHLMLNQPGQPSEGTLLDTPKLFINRVGEEPFPHPVIGRFQYPRNAVYF